MNSISMLRAPDVPDAGQTTGQLAAQLIERARALLPELRERAAETAERRQVAADTVARMRAAGLFRGFQPAAWGGLELDPQVVFDIQNVLAEGCASTAWLQSVLSVQAFALARFPQEAQRDVWGENPDMLACSSFMPTGQVSVAPGGYRLSGRWSFASGSAHCGWAVIGGLVPPEPGRERPEMRLFLVPAADYAIDDVWHVSGLRGTGSNDLVVADAFVPAYRSAVPDAGLLPLPVESGLPALYRMPWLYVFTSAISNLSIGVGRGALEAFLALSRTRRSGPDAARDNPAVRQAAASLSMAIDTASLVARRNLARLRDGAATGEAIALEEALLYRSELTGMLRQIAARVDDLMLLSGARAMRADSALGRAWSDLSAARLHPGNDPARTMQQYAGELLGTA